MAAKPSHYPAKARSVIFLFMDGGPSQMDTFDPKPRLDREHGQPIKVKTHPTQFNNVGNVLKSPWKFRQYGKSGIPVSDLFPLRRRAASMSWRSSGRWSRTSLSTRAPIISCTPAAACRADRAMGRGSTYGLGSKCAEPARFRGPQRRLDPPGRNGLLQHRLSAGRLSRIGLPARPPADRQHPSQDEPRRGSATQAGTAAQSSTRACWGAWARTTRSKRPSPITNWPTGCRRPFPT